MLVLSRRPNEKVIFPNLGITVQIVKVAGNAVRLGIDAPPEIPILREEVADASKLQDIPPLLSRRLRHEIRNRLNTASLGLHLLHRRLEAGDTEDAEPVIFKIFNELQDIDDQIGAANNEAQGSKTHTGRRALIVEDNANESELLAAYLRMNGYEVDTVDNGQQAITYLRQKRRPDAVLLDMYMPQLDGPKTITSIRDEPEWQNVKLFAVSGADRQELGIDVGPRGVDRWFSKPVNASQLVNELNRELDEAFMTA